LRLEVPVSFVLPVIVRASTDLNDVVSYVGKLDRGDSGKVMFLIFSHTRDHFKLTPAPPREDPCIVYGEPSGFTKEMLERLTQDEKIGGRPVKCGYSVEVTMHEHVGDRQLDLGAFRRLVAWKCDVVSEPLTAQIRGIVLGEVSLANPGKYPGINLGTVHPERPVEHRVTLDTDNPGVQLTLDKKNTVDFLDVKVVEDKDDNLKVEGRKSWTVSVTFKKDCGFRGQFPDPPQLEHRNCAVVFLVTHKGVQRKETERRIRIPVRGTVQALALERSPK
jgi:hypothetical protein